MEVGNRDGGAGSLVEGVTMMKMSESLEQANQDMNLCSG